MADLRSTYQKATSIKISQGKVVHLSYSISMTIDRSISTTLSKRDVKKK
jgi:hypothetical protein